MTNNRIIGQKKQAGPVNKRDSTANHKYIRKEWVNGKWKYYYRDDVQGAGKGLDILSGNATKRATSNASYTSKDGSRLNVRNTNKTLGGKRTRTVNVNGKPTQVTTVEVGKVERAGKKAANKAKSVAKKIKTETANERELIREGSAAIAKQTKKKAKNNKTVKKVTKSLSKTAKNVTKSLSKTAKKIEKTANKTIKKAKKTSAKNKKKAKKNVNKFIKNIGGNDLKKAIKKYKKSLKK